MYETRDLVRGWLKAESDLATLARMLQSPVALDAACFHAQQARAAALSIRHFVLQRLPADLAVYPGEANR